MYLTALPFPKWNFRLTNWCEENKRNRFWSCWRKSVGITFESQLKQVACAPVSKHHCKKLDILWIYMDLLISLGKVSQKKPQRLTQKSWQFIFPSNCSDAVDLSIDPEINENSSSFGDGHCFGKYSTQFVITSKSRFFSFGQIEFFCS